MPDLTLETFQAHLAESGVWPTGRTVVGYSGGADSACLVHLLAGLGVDFVAGHLHHGQRPEADAEADSCAEFCAKLNVSFVSGKADVPAIAAERKVGLEEAGRFARYEFLEQAKRAMGLAAIATAHTRSDHVETVLFHLVRGCGLRGLGGIRAESGDLVRPLLAFDREDTRAYCERHGLWFHDDPANSDPRFTRSRMRHEVLPILREMNPAVLGSIASLAALAAEEDAFLDAAAAAGLEQAELMVNGELAFLTRDIEVVFDRARLSHLPVILLRRALRLCVGVLGESLDHAVSDLAANGIRSKERGSITAEGGGGVIVQWNEKTIHVFREETASFEARELSMPGEVGAAEWRLRATPTPYAGQISQRSGLVAVFDAGLIQGQLAIRPIQPGDRLSPLGFHGHRKVSDLVSDAKLTQLVRRKLPIVTDAGGPLWIPGVALDGRVATSNHTKHVLSLVFEPASPERSSSN